MLLMFHMVGTGENGFNQAIELSAEILANVKFIQEKKLIGKYFEEISQDTGKYVFFFLEYAGELRIIILRRSRV